MFHFAVRIALFGNVQEVSVRLIAPKSNPNSLADTGRVRPLAPVPKTLLRISTQVDQPFFPKDDRLRHQFVENKVFPRGWWTARTGPVSADQSIRWALFSPESWGCPPVPTTRWAIGQLNRAAQAALRSLPSSYANFFILTAPLPPEESA